MSIKNKQPYRIDAQNPIRLYFLTTIDKVFTQFIESLFYFDGCII
nr:MAG TPA: hypothetical protein [Caudoviricetes sp.]